MNEVDINKAYVSVYDEFLAKFDRDHAPSASQLKEIKACARIAALRDGTDIPSEGDDVWEGF